MQSLDGEHDGVGGWLSVKQDEMARLEKISGGSLAGDARSSGK